MASQPTPETGLYVSTRYRLLRSLVATVDYSAWTRNSDGSTFKRLVPRLQFQPSFPIRLEWRHKWQARNEEVFARSVEISQTIEDRFRLRFLLSDRNNVSLHYHIGHTRWPSRGRLANTVEPGPPNRDSYPPLVDYSNDPDADRPTTPLQGSVTEPTTALSASVTHKVSERLKLSGGVTTFRGFFWNWEDTEFLVMDGAGTRTWISVWDRLSDRLSLYLKAVWHRQNTTTYRDSRYYNTEYEYYSLDNDAPLEMVESTNFRLQMDYAW